MKLYNVGLYSIGHGDDLGNDKYIGKIIVKRTLFGVEELKTNWPIRKVAFHTIGKKHPDSYLRPYAYKEFGYDLAILKEELLSLYVASPEAIESYLKNFDKSAVGKVFTEMGINNPEEKDKKLIKK